MSINSSICMIHLLLTFFLQSWLGVVKKAMKKDANLEIILYILDTVVHEDNAFFNYEAIFRGIVMQEQVPEEAVQAIADAIDPGVDSDGEGDSDDDDEDEESEDDETLKLNGSGTKVDPIVNGDGAKKASEDSVIYSKKREH